MSVEYPTDEELLKIKEWEASDYHGLMDYVYRLWEFKEFGWKREGDIYFLSTGGWSGNEDVISSLKDNQMFWLLYWYQHRRGGHYIFAPCSFETIKRLEELGLW